MADEEEKRDADHLRLLVSAAVVYSVVRAVELAITMDALWSWDRAPALMKWLIVWKFAEIAFLFFATLNLHNRTGRGFVLFVAFLACMDMPLGTVFGVLAILVMSRPSVARLFAARRMLAAQPPGPTQHKIGAWRRRRRERQRAAGERGAERVVSGDEPPAAPG